MKKQILKLSFVSLIGAVLVSGADAAPTVKKLGTGTLASSSQVASTAKTTSVTPARASSVRMNTAGSSIAKTTSLSSTKTPTNATKATAASAPTNSDEARLSLGKYLHGATIAKQEQSQEAETSTLTLLNLQARMADAEQDIDTLESNVGTLTSDLANHTGDTDAHVTAEQKAAWDDKQDQLTAGDGIKIETKNGETVISSLMNIPYGSPDGERTVVMWVE